MHLLAPQRRVQMGRAGGRILDKRGLGPAFGHIGKGGLPPRLRGEGKAADAPVGDHDQRLAKGGRQIGGADGEARAAFGKLARRHRLPAHEKVVEPPCARQASPIRHIQKRPVVGDQRFGVGEGEILLVALGRDSRPLRKEFLEMVGAHAHFAGQIVERQSAGARIDDLDRAADDVVVIAVFGRLDGHSGLRLWPPS